MKHLKIRGGIQQIKFCNAYESERVCSVLSANGVNCIAQLCGLTKNELHAIDQIGDATVRVIETALKEAGLKFGMTREELLDYETDGVIGVKSFSSFEDFLKFIAENEGGYNKDDMPIPGMGVLIRIPLPATEPSEHESSQEIDWTARFYEVAFEEFIRQGRTLTCDETRIERAIEAANKFIQAVKANMKETSKE